METTQQNTIHPYDRVLLARDASRPGAMEYIEALFTDFLELSGDRKFGDDKSIVGGIALFHGQPVTVIGHRKGKNLEENLACNFGMPSPEGYRKAERLMLQAEKFGRPIITFIDTPGAYPGLEAEARGQGEAIARCLYTMGGLKTPILSVVIGEGGSGGALALGICDHLMMLENAVYAILSPEGFSTILWKDPTRAREAAGLMKLTAGDLFDLGIADQVIPEPEKGITQGKHHVFAALDRVIEEQLAKLGAVKNIQDARYQKLRKIGTTFGKEK